MAGAAPGLQIRVPGRKTFRGVFDSHAFPPISSDVSEQLKLLLIFVLILMLMLMSSFLASRIFSVEIE